MRSLDFAALRAASLGTTKYVRCPPPEGVAENAGTAENPWRRIEVDAINGAVVRHGQRIQVPTPLNHMIYHTLVVMDHYNRQVT